MEPKSNEKRVSLPPQAKGFKPDWSHMTRIRNVASLAAREQFNFGAVVALSGVHPRTLDFWGKSGFLEPSIQKAVGTGSKRLYSFSDIIAARVARRFRERGVDLQGLRRVVTYLQNSRHLKDPPLDVRLVVLDDKVLITRSDSELVKAFNQTGQALGALVIDVGQTAQEVRRGLKDVARLRLPRG